MKIIEIDRLKEKIYYDKLDNGMEVYLYNNEHFKSNYVTFTTRFGAVNTTFVNQEGKLITVPYGIAHFLEHKVFVQENDPQPTEFYSETGTLCNAHTSLKLTGYEFSGPNNLDKNIEYLLDYVQSPYFTKENVESEKGIIREEIHMVNDRPWNVLLDRLRLNVFKNDPIRNSIAGSVDDINSITKEMLYDCYNAFYHPSNMFLVVVGNFDYEKILQLIKDNQAKKTFSDSFKIKKRKMTEEEAVLKENEIIYMKTDIPKVSFNVKIKNTGFGINVRKFNLYIYLLFIILFGEASSFDEEMKKKGIINNSLMFDILNTDNYLLISLLCETTKYEELIKEIKHILNKIEVTEEDLERKKRVLISNTIFTFESKELLNEMIVDDIIFDNKLNNKPFHLIESINIDELSSIIKNVNFNAINTTIICDKKNNS